jgi:DNA-binding LytR/AlgR family response regulator
MLKVLIIEDELPNADILKAHLERFSSEAQVCGVLRSNSEIAAWLPVNPRPDLVLCDIRLLDGDVFRSLEQGLITSPLIFTTAYSDFLQDAFDANGIAYLLKPVGYERFAAAMQKYLSLQESFRVKDWHLISSLVVGKRQSYRERLVVKTASGFTLLQLERVCCITAQEGRCTALDTEGGEHVFRYKMSDLVQELDPNKFFQINRGEIVNLDHIQHIEPYFGDRLAIRVKRNPLVMITSAAQTPAFRQWIDR